MKRANSSPYRVQVLDRALSVIDAIAQVNEECSLSHISQAASLHKSTAHRILMVLERHRLVSKSSLTGRYRLGLKLYELGSRAVNEQNDGGKPARAVFIRENDRKTGS